MLGAFLPHQVEPDTATKTHAVYMINGPIHYDLVLPLNAETRDAFERISYDALNITEARHLIIGWGARDFYTTVGGYSDVSLRAVRRGIFGDSAVMRLDVAGALPPDHGLRALSLTRAQYKKLLSAIISSFAADTPILQGNFTPTDAYYPANRRFHILRTCNVWVGETLRRAGIRFGTWTPLTLSVSMSHWWYHGRGA